MPLVSAVPSNICRQNAGSQFLEMLFKNRKVALFPLSGENTLVIIQLK